MSPMQPVNNRQLVKPSKFEQWGVQIVSLVPMSVQDVLSKVAVGAASHSWTALALPEGVIHVFFQRPASLSQELNSPQWGYKLYHPGLKSSAPLVAVHSTDHGATPCAHVYGVARDSGAVFFWLIRHDKTTSSIPKSPQVRLKLPLDPDESITCLSCDPLVIGTSWGRLFWCTQTLQPLALFTQLMERPSSSSLLGRFLSGTSIVQEPPIHSILRLTHKNFLSVSALGILELWKVTTMVASAHQANFEMTPIAELQDEIQSLLPDASDVSVIQANCFELDRSSHGLNFILRLVFEGEARIYWVQGTFQDGTDFILQNAVWLNKFHATEIVCVGLVTTQEHVSYAAFQYESLPVTIMALMTDSNVLQEVDLPPVKAPKLILGTMLSDIVTHGFCALSVSGFGLRGRWTGLELGTAVSATPKKRRTSPSSIATLTSHLKSAFWNWYQNSSTLRLPPSLIKATPQDLEPAILATATQLQMEGDDSSVRNPMKWHLSLMDLLQQGGLYKSLSAPGRHALLGIGQELAVFTDLAQQEIQYGLSDNACQPHAVADWLQSLKEMQQKGTINSELVLQLIVTAVRTATQYRSSQSSSMYDISKHSTPTKLWTHHPVLQTLLLRQIDEWNDRSSSEPDAGAVAIVVGAALESLGETQYDDSNGVSRYDKTKAGSIPLVQRVVSDELAFELSVKHGWFHGICQLALGHEDDETSFSIQPLLRTFTGRDHQTNLDFASFVLQWHANRSLFGHVLDHGQHCSQQILASFLEKDDRVREYHWIPQIRNGQFDDATSYLMKNAERPDATLPSSRWALSMAKLSNQVAKQENDKFSTLMKQDLIDRNMELINAQEVLMQKTGMQGQKQKLSSENLLSDLFNLLDKVQDDTEEAVQLCLIGLAISRLLPDEHKRAGVASRVWASSLLVDLPTWTDLIQAQQSANREQLQANILEATVFGLVLQQYQDNTSRSDDDVLYNTEMENDVLKQLNLDSVTIFEMKRLLRVATNTVAITPLEPAATFVPLHTQ